MRNVLAIAQKDLLIYFASPIAYVVAAAFLFISGFLFAIIVNELKQAEMRTIFDNMTVIFLIISPALTMRLLSEELRTGTIELMLTGPVREAEVIIGKFLAALGLLVAMIAPTLYYVFILWLFGSPDWGPIATGYLGVLLLGAACMSIGIMASSFTQNQIVAAILTLGILLFMWILGGAARIFTGTAASVLRYLTITDHLTDFARGVIDSRHIVYYLAVISVSLFVAYASLQSRRWR
ncbi:MAG: ABC transporter permease subunit [Chloroflexi bacterium]|nr:ABC transporter permease subunit [Chloroflexota bacterium]